MLMSKQRALLLELELIQGILSLNWVRESSRKNLAKVKTIRISFEVYSTKKERHIDECEYILTFSQCVPMKEF